MRSCQTWSSANLSATDHALVCHPATPCAVPLQLSVSLAAAGSEEGPGLLLRYRVTCAEAAEASALARLRLPEAAPPGPADGLWQHTCFEAFVGVAGESAYREFNFSPSCQWAAYRFSGPRQRDAAAEADDAQARAAAPTGALVPEISLHTDPGGLTLLAWLPLRALADAQALTTGQPLDVGLSAVIETTDGQLSYWALQHPAPRPDFHHRSGWQHLPELPALLAPAIPLLAARPTPTSAP